MRRRLLGRTTMRSIRCGLLLPLHVDLPVPVSVCLFVTTVTPPKTVEPIEDAVYGGKFGRQTRDHLLSGNPNPPPMGRCTFAAHTWACPSAVDVLNIIRWGAEAMRLLASGSVLLVVCK